MATAELTRRLCRASLRSGNEVLRPLDWPETLDREGWFTSPELVSVYGTPVWDALSEPERKRLSFWEAVNFYSLNARGEKPLIEGLARRLYCRGFEGVDAYLHHMIDEENRHMAMFAEFCRRYAGKMYPDRNVAFPREYAPGEEDFLFFARVLLFEEIVDVFNSRMAGDPRLVPIARDINASHHRDEARHLAFGRSMVREIFSHWRGTWNETTYAGIRDHLMQYSKSLWAEYCNPEVYADAGIPDPGGVAALARTHRVCRERQRRIACSAIRFFLQVGILEETP